jgi:hypothetical protein
MKFSMQAKAYYTIIFFCLLIFPFGLSKAQEKSEAGAGKEILEIDGKKVLTEHYTVKHGDHLWQILRDRGLLEKKDFQELLALLRILNNSLPDLSWIEPGNKLIIPLSIVANESPPQTPLKTTDVTVSPKSFNEPDREEEPVLKKEEPITGPFSKTPIPESVEKPPSKGPEWTSRQLGEIFVQMGEEWVQTGKHFIPLKSGGEVSLKADSYPIINLSNGNRVIVDLKTDLPEKMAHLITSSWENYRIASLTEADDLRSALGKIFSVCDYKKIYKNGEPFETGDDISVLITADWIIKPITGHPDELEKVIIITLTDGPASETPNEIKKYLKSLGILTIDYPPAEDPTDTPMEKAVILSADQERSNLIEIILNLSGQTFSRKVEIPIYRNQKTDFNLIIEADFLFEKEGREYIIDLTGLGSDIISLLRQHQFSVMSLPDEKDPYLILPVVLDFIGVKAYSGSHPFWTAHRDDAKNIKITIPGVSFRDHQGQNIFATPLRLPEEVASFLSSKGYKILSVAIPSYPTRFNRDPSKSVSGNIKP